MYLLAVGEISRQSQNPTRIASGESLQGFGTACRERQTMPLGKQQARQLQTDATAGAGQPDSP